jgi:SAM-dependent methyltransferase
MKEIDAAIDLDNPDRFHDIRSILGKKGSLRRLYEEVYQKYDDCIQRSVPGGLAVEIGSGAGFAKEAIPKIITSDVVAYPNIERIMDATRLDFPDQSLSSICMFGVLHHIPDTPAFFHEAIRCLKPGGRVFMVEPYAGWISTSVLRYLHHENFDLHVKSWKFESKGPVSDANSALPTVIFERDRTRFSEEFKALSLIRFEPNMPLRYWLTGGLRKWSLLPDWAYRYSQWLDKKLIQVSPRFGSFVDIELLKI